MEDAQNDQVGQNLEDVTKKGADTVDRAAAAFDKAAQRFGAVLAIGPPTYIELATDFSKGNPFADMPPDQAFTLLLAGLDDRQRTALTSKAGLGFSDLTTTAQKTDVSSPAAGTGGQRLA